MVYGMVWLFSRDEALSRNGVRTDRVCRRRAHHLEAAAEIRSTGVAFRLMPQSRIGDVSGPSSARGAKFWDVLASRAGGEPGQIGRNSVERADGTVEFLGGCAETMMRPGDVLVIETPGGGGYGTARIPGAEADEAF